MFQVKYSWVFILKLVKLVYYIKDTIKKVSKQQVM